jgi:phosphatidylinositol kinase/protein kinase (PI-3  family)
MALTFGSAAADIRTYAVTPLNDECGLCQWVNNTIPLRNILQKVYSSKGIQIYVRLALLCRDFFLARLSR